MSAELQEFHSYAYFKRIVPRNPIDWEGRVILYAAISEKFFRIAFGTGDNLTDDDTDEGFDDYIMADQYELDGYRTLGEIVGEAMVKGDIDDDTIGLKEVDGGQLLLRRSEWKDGDVRRFIMEALDFSGYKLPELVPNSIAHMDIVYIGADYDNLNLKGLVMKNGTRQELHDR